MPNPSCGCRHCGVVYWLEWRTWKLPFGTMSLWWCTSCERLAHRDEIYPVLP